MKPAKPILSGLINGVIAGLVMAVVMMLVFALVVGTSPLYPVQVIGATIYGEEGLVGLHVPALLSGLVIHMIISIVWGIIFGLVAISFNIVTAGKALVFGILLGVVSMIDVHFLVPRFMQWLGRTDIWNREVPMFWDWAAHIVFGASFVVYPAVNRWLTPKH